MRRRSCRWSSLAPHGGQRRSCHDVSFAGRALPYPGARSAAYSFSDEVKASRRKAPQDSRGTASSFGFSSLACSSAVRRDASDAQMRRQSIKSSRSEWCAALQPMTGECLPCPRPFHFLGPPVQLFAPGFRPSAGRSPPAFGLCRGGVSHSPLGVEGAYPLTLCHCSALRRCGGALARAPG